MRASLPLALGACVLLPLFLAACSSEPVLVIPREEGELPITLGEQGAPVTVSEGWLDFSTLRFVPSGAGDEPDGPRVLAHTRGGVLRAPFGPVENMDESWLDDRMLSRGWLRLRDRSFFSTAGGTPPEGPYIAGWRDEETGGFLPRGEVVLEAPVLALEGAGAEEDPGSAEASAEALSEEADSESKAQDEGAASEDELPGTEGPQSPEQRGSDRAAPR